jgi:hypothetical protein
MKYVIIFALIGIIMFLMTVWRYVKGRDYDDD